MTDNLINGMSKREDLRIVPHLLERLWSEDDTTANRAKRELWLIAVKVWKLDEVGRANIPDLLKALDAEDKAIRISAIWGLNWLAQREFDDPKLHTQSVIALAGMLNDEDGDIRLSAIHALKQFGDSGATAALVNCLSDEHKLLTAAAAEALGCIQDKNAVPGLLGALENSTDVMVRHSIILALGSIGDVRTTPALIALLQSGDTLRGYAASSLGKIGNKRATPVLLETLRNDSSQEVREWIVYGLGLMKDSRAIPDLIDVLNTVGREARLTVRLRENAILALGRIGDESALPALLGAIDNAPEWQTSMRAIDVLHQVTSLEKAATLLIEMLLHHKTDYVRGFAARALGYLANSTENSALRDRIVSNLIDSLSDTGISCHYMPHVCDEAARALRFIGTPEALAAIENWQLHTGP